MRRRVLIWAGTVVAVAAMAGLGVYFWRVGLDDADKLASVIGVFVALAGLGTAQEVQRADVGEVEPVHVLIAHGL